jgi:hypothetical protein
MMQTNGGESVTLVGTNLGPVDTPVTATYGGADGRRYDATNCVVSVGTPHDRITCDTAVGTGASLKWRTTVGAQESDASTATTSYIGPSVSDVLPYTPVDTRGSETITLSGSNLGPVGRSLNPVTASYSTVYRGSTLTFDGVLCNVTVAHSEIQCWSSPGMGHLFAWEVVVDGQTSSPSTATLSYKVPEISSLTGVRPSALNTVGGDVVVVTGDWFGPDIVENFVNASYGPSGVELLITECTLVVPHTQMNCSVIAGVGAAQPWFVTVGDQTSVVASSATTSYAVPVVNSLSGALSMSTEGGEIVRLTGEQMGPAGASFVGYAVGANYSSAVAGPYSAVSCTVETAYTVVRCETVEGVSANHTWRVSIGDQWSVWSTSMTSYIAPDIDSFEGTTSMQTNSGESIT